jgi:hypothetical protein
MSHLKQGYTCKDPTGTIWKVLGVVHSLIDGCTQEPSIGITVSQLSPADMIIHLHGGSLTTP